MRGDPRMEHERPEAVIEEHRIVVPRTARYYTLGPTHGFPREVWIVCHGFGQLAARFLQSFAPLDDGTRLIVAPEALSRYYLDSIAQRRGQEAPRVGATWMTKEFRDAEIADYVGYLDLVATEIRHHLTGASPRFVVLGFSQGTATVARWLGASDFRADELILWGGQIPPELEASEWAGRLHGAGITLVAGNEDNYITPKVLAAEAEKLSEAGVPHHVVRFEGGHAIDAATLVTLAERFTAR